MIFVLVGEEGRAALGTIPDGAVVHAVGWYPQHGETARAVVCHTRKESDVAQVVSADKVIGGDPALWSTAEIRADYAEPTPDHAENTPDYAEPTPTPSKRRGRPPKVKP